MKRTLMVSLAFIIMGLASTYASEVSIDTIPVDSLLEMPLEQAAGKCIPADNGDSELSLAGLALICVFVVPCLCSLIALIMVLKYCQRREIRREALVELSLQKGLPLPERFFGNRPCNSKWASGLTWLAWGIGLLVFFIVTDHINLAALMAVPCLIGTSKLLAAYISYRCLKGNEREN